MAQGTKLLDINESRLAFFESSKDMIVSVAEDFTVADANPYTFRVSGYKRKEIIGAPLRKFIPRKYWPQLKESLQKIFSGEVFRGTVEVSIKKGGWMPVEIVGVPVVVNGKKYAQGLARDITRRRVLRKFRSKLMQLLIHDLKNPLIPILANVEFFRKKTQVIDHEEAEALGDIVLCVEKLRKMIGTMSEIFRLEDENFPLNRKSIRISDILNSVFREFSQACKNRGVTLTMHHPPKGQVVWVDTFLISRVFENMITNALYVLPQRGSIVLGAKGSPGETIFSVFDSGPGLTRKARALLSLDGGFDPAGPLRHEAMGLYFCRLAVEAHGGRIWAEGRRGPGKTIFFSIRNPEMSQGAGRSKSGSSRGLLLTNSVFRV